MSLCCSVSHHIIVAAAQGSGSVWKCYKHSNCGKTRTTTNVSMPGLSVFSWLWCHFMCFVYASVTVGMSCGRKGKGERARKQEGTSGEQRTQTLARVCVKFSVQILALAEDIELNLIFLQFCEGRLDSCLNFPREKRFALCRCLSLTMAISFKGVESPALGLLEI